MRMRRLYEARSRPAIGKQRLQLSDLSDGTNR
jgi:hypothetical protein